jgi:hypothetical protein
MPNIFNDGTQVDQIIFDDATISGTSITSDYMAVPALYTGRLEVVFMGGSTDCSLITNPATIEIKYYDKTKSSTIHTWSSYVNIPASTYSKGKILTEFHIPYRKLKEVANGDKVSYVTIKLSYTTGSSGKVNAYLVWK